MKAKRIDDYICINIDQVICDEMEIIVNTDCGSSMQEDRDAWDRLQEAAKVILENYRAPD